MLWSNGRAHDEVISVCSFCRKAEQMGGAVRCMACGRWVPRVDRLKTKPCSGTATEPREGERDDRSCPKCQPHQQQPRVTIQLPHRVFYKCDRCLSVWSLEVTRRQIPGRPEQRL
jgi:hypothetical protein